MTIGELARMARRQWIAMLVVLVATAAVAIGFRHTKPLYQDHGTVAFSAPPAEASAIDSLIITAFVIVERMNSSEGAQLVYRAGGGADYQFSLVNFYNEEYPDYSVPLATLVTTSYSPLAAQRTFDAALRALEQDVEDQQAVLRVPAGARINTDLVGSSSGPIAQKGSPIRTFAGLALLALVAAYFVGTLLDRHRGWGSLLHSLLHFRHRARAAHRLHSRGLCYSDRTSPSLRHDPS